MHRIAVTEFFMILNMPPMAGEADALWRMSDEEYDAGTRHNSVRGA
jgi:hypothetical protein